MRISRLQFFIYETGFVLTSPFNGLNWSIMADLTTNITIKKIASDLKLAVSTVSKALNDSYEISQATKSLVVRYAEKLNYVPNIYASSLRKRKTRNVAVVLSEVADSFFATAMSGIESVAEQKNYHVIIYLTHEDKARERDILKSFRGGRVDGVLLSVVSNKNSKYISALQKMPLPIVLFDRICENIEVPQVSTDDFESSYRITEHLLKKGCRKIVYLSFAGELSTFHNRLNGYKKALDDHGIKLYRKNIVQCSNQHLLNYELIKKNLQRTSRPDGIIASVERLTSTVYQVCEELRLSIPSHVKVASFSNIEVAPFLNPSLTTITQPAFEIGKTAMQLLFKDMEGDNSTKEKTRMRVIPSVLHERDSTQ